MTSLAGGAQGPKHVFRPQGEGVRLASEVLFKDKTGRPNRRPHCGPEGPGSCACPSRPLTDTVCPSQRLCSAPSRLSRRPALGHLPKPTWVNHGASGLTAPWSVPLFPARHPADLATPLTSAGTPMADKATSHSRPSMASSRLRPFLPRCSCRACLFAGSQTPPKPPRAFTDTQGTA